MKLSRSFHVSLRKVDEALAPYRPFDTLTGGAKAKADVAYAAFWRTTRRIWRGIAATLYARWTPTSAVTTDDVEQQLSLAAWNLLREGKWDPAKGRNLADYVVFNACNKAKYWLHQQRGANLHGNHDKNPSRYARSFTELGIDFTQSTAQGERGVAKRAHAKGRNLSLPHRIAKRMSVGPAQEAMVERREKLEDLLLECRTARERFALCALFYNDGSQVLAARAIYADTTIRLICRFGSEAQAASAVRHAASTYLGIGEE